MKTKLKLFVWTGFERDWTGGLAFAIAETEEEAKKLVEESHWPVGVSNWGELVVLEIKKTAFAVSGGG